MPTSSKTNREICKVLDKHLTFVQQVNLFTDLSKVEGNSSFTESIRNLLAIIVTVKNQKRTY